uniref:Uncharacterized protein n=1 Tax=Timema monikensis TaxID=170555 RepID=A0A7R9EE90_9NEOP|nr:unnamed protein product [Timema monikensis]
MFTNVYKYKKYFSTTNNSAILRTPDGLNMVLNAYYPLDTTNPTNERIVCLHYMCGAMCCALMCASVDAFYFSLMIALRAHFSLLNTTLRNLVDGDSPHDQNRWGDSSKLYSLMKSKTSQSSGMFLEEPVENTRNVTSEPDVVDCIEYHQTLLSYAERLRRLFSPSLFFQYVIISINLCFTLYQLSSISARSFLFLSQSFFLGCLVFQQGLMCWYANEISVESSEVGMAAYKCPWYDASPKFKFRIQNIMRRSQKPAAITAGMFGALSMWAFTGVLQTSYSYFAVLRQSNTR